MNVPATLDTIRTMPRAAALAALAALPPWARNLTAARTLAQEIEQGTTPTPAAPTTYPTKEAATTAARSTPAARTSTPPRSTNAEQIARTNEVYDWTRARGYPSEILGDWVWIEFGSKPDAATIAGLKSRGFRWVKVRGRWAHDCGHKSKRGRGDPRDKYRDRSKERETAAA